MNRNLRNIYLFISDENKKFYRANLLNDGSWNVTSNSQPYPIMDQPDNMKNSPLEFSTNNFYFSLVRTINYPLNFVGDGAAILRYLYHTKKKIAQKVYLTVIEWDGERNCYVLSYNGRIDLKKKLENIKTASFSVPIIDNSAWGIISQNDDVEYPIECNKSNPKAIKVLIDSINLESTYTFQTVGSAIPYQGPNFPRKVRFCMPLVLINTDGDSAGIITKNQTQVEFPYDYNTVFVDQTLPYFFFGTAYPITGAHISGTLVLPAVPYNAGSTTYTFAIYIRSNFGKKILITPVVFPNAGCVITAGNTYSFPFDITIDLDPGENLFFIIDYGGILGPSNLGPIVIPNITNIKVKVKTKVEDSVVYALRPLDVLQEIARQSSNGLHTIKSDFLFFNNKSVILSGDSIRGVENAKVYYSLKNFFKDFNSLYFTAFKNVEGDLWFEKATDVYNAINTVIDLGECIECEIEPAEEFYYNQIEVGSPIKDYRHPSGRLEFNSTNEYAIDFDNVKKKLSLVTSSRLGCYDVIFLLLDYRYGSTKDNDGDKNVYILDISDDIATGSDIVETFENINIDTDPLQPYINSPYNNDYITNDKPAISGKGKPGRTVNVYCDDIFDGSTVVQPDGSWSYVVQNSLTSYDPGVFTGEHIIKASFFDLSAPVSSINVIINTLANTQPVITYPTQSDGLYNNTPLIKGVAQAGTNIDISIDGVFIATVVADQSCKWSFRSPVLSNGNHTVSINANLYSISFSVDTNVEFPLITYIDGDLDGSVIVNSKPLIKGVAIPGTNVTLWLNYIQYANLGTATADSNGNWSIQVSDTYYLDPVSHIPVALAPIRNGLSIVSTDLINHNVKVNISGYKLNRPDYNLIEGVPDNSVFNTRFSPSRMMYNHYPRFAPMFENNNTGIIRAIKQDKNGNLRTVLGNEVFQENANIKASSLGIPIAKYEWAKIKVAANSTFAKTLYNFNSYGKIKFTYKGDEIYCLPIGSMKIQHIRSDVQEWKLLLSREVTNAQLLNLSKNGLKIQLMENSIYRSDYNTFHFVVYDFQPNIKYNFKTVYEELFSNRNEAWLRNPRYTQKIQKTDIITDQIITNGVTGVVMKIYNCFDASLVDTIPYNAANPAPISLPEIVLEAKPDFSNYEEGVYFAVIFVSDTPICISEKFHIKEKWKNTICIEGRNKKNLTGVYFSTGFKCFLRVEGLIKKLDADIDNVIAVDESGNSQLLYGEMMKKREIRFGTAYGIPDYLFLRVSNFITLTDWSADGVMYTTIQDEKITKSEDVPGHPLYYYNIKVRLKENFKGVVFPGQPGADISGVILTVDSQAIGLPAGSLINIELPNQ